MAAATDRVFPDWTVAKAQRWLALILGTVGVWAAASSYIAARLVTRSEVTTRFDSLKTDLRAVSGSTKVRLDRFEEWQSEVEMTHRLLPAMARTQCILLDRDQSPSIAQASGLPCDSLLFRRIPIR
jgi:hypothetical protein